MASTSVAIPQQMQQQQQPAQGGPTQQFEHSPENPKVGDKQQQLRKSGLTEEQEQEVVTGIISAYRTQWATDRIMRFPNWLKNTEFDKGRQILGWDPITRTYFDAVAYARINNQETDYSYLERYINNITQMLRRNFAAAVGRAVPPVVVMPENSDILADRTTATAAQEAISIIERNNRAKSMLALECQYLYLYGVYFKWTRFKIDGAWMGYKDIPNYEETQVQVSQDRFHCTSCGNDMDANQVDITSPDSMECTNCGSNLSPEDYWPGEFDTATAVTGYTKRPNGMVKWSVYSPLQIDADPTVDNICETDILALEQEINIGQLRATFPDMADDITEGTESGTSDNASYERLVRTMVYSSGYTVTADIFSSRVTFTQVWLQPDSYYRLNDNTELRDRLRQLYPYGCKFSICGAKVLDVRPAVLEKEWTACKLHEGYGLYPPSVADNVVPFNERFNQVNNILDDYMERCSTGITMVDPRRVDVRALSGKPLSGAVLNEIPTRSEGVTQNLGDAFAHYAFKLEPGIFSYLDRLMNNCQLIAGIPPQVSGTGTTEGVETAKGQKQMLDQAMGSLGDIYGRIKSEHAEAGQNAVECLQQNMRYTGSIWSVIQENGSQFRNQYVHFDEMEGRVRVYPNTDEGLPLSPEQKRQWIQNMMEEASKQNPIALSWFDVPSNQELAARYVGLPESKTPGSAQQAKTLQDVAMLLGTANAMRPKMQPNGQPILDDDGTPMMLPSIQPDKWIEDYTVLRPTIEEFCRENCDTKKNNPMGWQNVIAYYRVACEYESEVKAYHNSLNLKAQQAAQPQGPEANPVIQQLEAEGLKAATGAVDRLVNLGSMPPLSMGQSIQGQVSANKELVDAVEKMIKK